MARRYWIFHYLLRVVVMANFALFGAMLNPTILHWISRTALGQIIGKWLVASTIVLPSLAILETLLMRGKVPGRTLCIDVACTAAWFCFFWGATLYGAGHYAMF